MTAGMGREGERGRGIEIDWREVESGLGTGKKHFGCTLVILSSGLLVYLFTLLLLVA